MCVCICVRLRVTACVLCACVCDWCVWLCRRPDIAPSTATCVTVLCTGGGRSDGMSSSSSVATHTRTRKHTHTHTDIHIHTHTAAAVAAAARAQAVRGRGGGRTQHSDCGVWDERERTESVTGKTTAAIYASLRSLHFNARPFAFGKWNNNYHNSSRRDFPSYLPFIYISGEYLWIPLLNQCSEICLLKKKEKKSSDTEKKELVKQVLDLAVLKFTE